VDEERRTLERRLAASPGDAEAENALLAVRDRAGEPVRAELFARFNAAITREIRRRAPFHTGTFVDRPNANRRIYPRAVLEGELGRTSDLVARRLMRGQLAHPPDGVSRIDDVSHFVTEAALDPETGEIVVNIEPTRLPPGQALADMLRLGTRISLRSRGMGSVREGPDGAYVVEADYRLMSFDFVTEPNESESP